MKEVQQASDMELIERCRRHDDEAFNCLYSRYRLQLFSYIHKLLPGNHSLTDDIFQQVWIKAVANWERYDDRQKLLAWLCRIAHNLVMDHYRRQAHCETVELQDSYASDYTGAMEAIDNRIFDEALARATESLSADQKQVLEMRRLGLSFKEIAEKQHTNLNTVLGRMHYAVEKLRSRLKEFL